MKKMFVILAMAAGARVLAQDPTEVKEVKVTYARSYSLVRSMTGNGHANYEQFGAIGGRVAYTGPGPVFVTLRIGGQVYNTPVSQDGGYSYWIFTNNYGSFEVEAWTPGGLPVKTSRRELQPR